MKKLLLLSALLIFACSSAQNITVLNKMVESNQSLVGLEIAELKEEDMPKINIFRL